MPARPDLFALGRRCRPVQDRRHHRRGRVKASPDFEHPQDAGGNNVYDVKVIASDGVKHDVAGRAISVTNANEGPTLTSGANGERQRECDRPGLHATATDPDAGRP